MDILHSIREGTAADAGPLSSLIRDSFRDVAERFAITPENCPKHPSNCTREWIVADQDRGVRFFILSQGDEPVGCVGVESVGGGVGYLERLAVTPKRRRNGFGRELVLHAMEYASTIGVLRMSIGIIADQYELKHWYQRMGFVEVGIRRFDHLPFKVCLMEKDIPPFQRVEKHILS